MKNHSVTMDISSLGEDYEMEECISDLFDLNVLVQTRDGRVLPIRINNINVKEESTDKDENENSGVKDDLNK